MGRVKRYILEKGRISTRLSLSYILVGIISALIIDRILIAVFQKNSSFEMEFFIFSGFFIVLTGVFLFIILNHMQKVISKITRSYYDLKKQDKDRLMPYEFALDNSIDAIYWFTLDAKFIYVNEAACKMIGRTKEEFLNEMYLEDMDPNFNRDSAKECMKEIFNSKYWRLETTQIRKDGSIFPVEVSAHGFNHGGKLYVCAFARNMTLKQDFRTKITKMNQELQKSLEEKNILLKEIHHRVKNNMEIISSLLNMQARRTEDEEIIYILQQSRSRIHTMALVHEFLYLGENLAFINLPSYIKRLVEDIKELYISQNTKLEVDVHIDDLNFSTNRCIQIGMVLHELCVNSLKYAFKEDRNNLLCIHIKKEEEKIRVKIRDNGDGLKDIDSLYKSDSIGMQLIHSIVEDQLDGEIKFENKNGLECNIVFAKDEEE